MKSISVLLLLVGMCLATSHANAQVCPNADFESWTTHSFSQPDSSWYTTNNLSLSIADTLTVWPVTGVSGQAMHIHTAIIGTDTLAAQVTLGTMIIIPRYFSAYPSTGGIPYTHMPTALTGQYRYSLPGNDSAIIQVVFKKAGAIVGNNIFKIRGSGSLSTFTSFSFPLTVSLTPDSVILVASASNISGSGMQSGSWLELDDLALTVAGSAELLPGGSFNSWSSRTYEQPQQWRSILFGTTPAVTKSTTHFSGNYSVQLTTQPAAPHSWGGIVSPAQLSLAGFPFLFGYSGGREHAGVLCTDTLGFLGGYYQYIPAGIDSAEYTLSVTRYKGDLGVQYVFGKLGASPTWRYFEIPYHTPFVTPDSINVTFASGYYDNPVSGSILRLDSLFFTPTSHLAVAGNAILPGDVSVYPNPSSGIYHLSSPRALTAITATVYSSNGALVLTQPLSGTTALLDLTHQPPGLYFLRLCDSSGSLIKHTALVNSTR